MADLRGDASAATRRFALFQAPPDLLASVEKQFKEASSKGQTADILHIRGGSSSSSAGAVLCTTGRTFSLRGLASTDTYIATPDSPVSVFQFQPDKDSANKTDGDESMGIGEGSEPPLKRVKSPRGGSDRAVILPPLQYELARTRPQLQAAIQNVVEKFSRFIISATDSVSADGVAGKIKCEEEAGVPWSMLRRELPASDLEILAGLHRAGMFVVQATDSEVKTPSSVVHVLDDSGETVALPSVSTRFICLPREIRDDALDAILQEAAVRNWPLRSLSQKALIQSLREGGFDSFMTDAASSATTPKAFSVETAVSHALRGAAELDDGADFLFESCRTLDGDYVFALSDRAICAFRARRILARADAEDRAEREAAGNQSLCDMPLSQFVERWNARVPPGVEPDLLRHLSGVGVVVNRFRAKGTKNQASPVVRLIDGSALALTLRQRANFLFSACEVWALPDIEPFIEPVLAEGETVEEALVRVARTQTIELEGNGYGDALGVHDSSVRVFCARHLG